MKNVAYGFALSAVLLTVSGCNWFCGSKDAAPASQPAKAVAENDQAAVVDAATAVADATTPPTEENAVAAEVAATEKVATADTMPMNEVAPAQEAEKAA